MTNPSHSVHEVPHEAAAHSAAHAPHELPNWVTILHEKFPGSPLVDLLHRSENILFALTVAFVIGTVGIVASRKKDLIPDNLRNFVEAVVEFLETFVTGILGEAGRKHVPYLGTLFLYILLMNWSGLIPLFKSPTSAWSTTLALALTTLVYVQLTGIREQGILHYLMHLAGNPKGIFGILVLPLMLVLNIILEFGAVPFSLSLRLFANISSEDRLLLNFAQLALASKFIAFPFQLFANLLAIIFSTVQAFVFMLLSTVYIALVMPHEEHHHEAAHA